MPQELVWGQGSYDARVGWTTGSPEVQLAVEVKDGARTLVEQLYADEDERNEIGWAVMKLVGDGTSGWDSKELGAAIVDILAHRGGDPSQPSYVAVWATIDRDGANRLIRMLRRARDAAFGRDE
jgi:hypothetical protein